MDHNHMASTTGAMAATGTMTGMAASATTKAAMSGMGGGSCKISMLWNWNIIDSCFIARSWRITSHGMFAGSCIGVILLVMSLEMLRRAVKEYDRYLIRSHKARWVAAGAGAPSSESAGDHGKAGSSSAVAAANAVVIPPFRPNVLQQAVRALIHMCQFAVAYFVMLLAMYYNGYLIICIFIGSYIGSFIFQWETLYDEATSAAREATVCCG
ncbi:ctr copper transporter [Colletotrichum truncatum]|uniref:Ctr copper transporter n=1 Tax=Colletotrichum truncatum TaxID=5467 RepID=A0ACC3YWL7_COLTU|nr:ctr copper transporter [Colletotrichum truncatum]KAF6781083.1 ctr copper transporter [Colletotrichum truncatum]